MVISTTMRYPVAGGVETERDERSEQVVRMLQLQLGRPPSAAETGALMELMDVQRVDKVGNPHSQEMHREQSQSVRHQDSQCENETASVTARQSY